MTKDEALKLALEALEDFHTDGYRRESCYSIITALRQALAEQPAQEPVAYIRVSKTGHVMACAKTGDFYSLPDGTLLYTRPQARQWVGLTDEEIHDCMSISIQQTCRAIEAKLKERNT